MVEHQLPKLRVVGSSPIARFGSVEPFRRITERPKRALFSFLWSSFGQVASDAKSEQRITSTVGLTR